MGPWVHTSAGGPDHGVRPRDGLVIASDGIRSVTELPVYRILKTGPVHRRLGLNERVVLLTSVRADLFIANEPAVHASIAKAEFWALRQRLSFTFQLLLYLL